MSGIGKKRSKVSAIPGKLLHAQENSAGASIRVSFGLSSADWDKSNIHSQPKSRPRQNESKHTKRERIETSAGGATGNVQEKSFIINCPDLQGGGNVDAVLARTYG
jgi:hypothetical protein